MRSRGSHATCRWDVAGPEPVLEASFDGHADWVNDLALIGDLLITCSNDQTVRLWKAGSDNGAEGRGRVRWGGVGLRDCD
jgi:WD40 repeat protein